MSSALSIPAPERAASERHLRILEAAERVFTRAGFHAATMNEVAIEAGTSPGNLYRYFAGKDALIAAIVERDRSRIAADFARLDHERPILPQLAAFARHHMVEEPRTKAVMALQIWAESARNPDLARTCTAIDGVVFQGLSAAFAAAKRQGELPADLDDARYLQILLLMADGIFCRRGIDPDFDAEAAVATLVNTMYRLPALFGRPEPSAP